MTGTAIKLNARTQLVLALFRELTKIPSRYTETTNMKNVRDAVLILAGLVLFYFIINKLF